MTDKTLVNAIMEADRFILLAKLALYEFQKSPYRGSITGTKKTAATRRASMDLTRSLAEMRKP